MVDLTTLFQVTDISYTPSSDHVQIVVTTDVACHLYCRMTWIEPKRHLKPVRVRGVNFITEIYHCFDSYEDNEQSEAGDTLTHTFEKPDWPFCQTRWFYFWGTRGGNPSPSESCIFKYHQQYEASFGPETDDYFYPDPGTGLTTVDGIAARSVRYQTWSGIRDGAGSFAFPSGIIAHALIYADTGSNQWRYLSRFLMLFDTSSIPVGSQINSASLKLKSAVVDQQLGDASYWGIYGSDPISENNLVGADYQNIYSILLSDEQTFPDGWGPGQPEFIFNASGLAAIAAGGITKLCLRSSNHDVADIAPSWVSGKRNKLQAATADNASSSKWPQLHVYWQPPL